MQLFTARRALCVCVLLSGLAAAGPAQTWNDPRTRALVSLATTRRAQQLADTGLTDYHATAHGYVTFLAQLGEGFVTPPKILKADELALEVYWKAPNLSKQRIVGRRDTLLLPTDIQYHRDHLGIVQNNFPNIIRLGDGDEVADVPHPLSPAGLNLYDFALTDSFAIQSASGRIVVQEVKVRPKDDRQPRVIGAVYIDPAAGQVVKFAFNFTRAAFLDKQLEGLEITLENRLVGTRFWLPSKQSIEIRRSGTWLDYPVRGIIRGRWDISDYEFNIKLPTQVFAGPEIVSASPQELARHQWQGKILDALPPDVRATTDPNVAAVQEEARRLVRAQALAHVRQTAISARGISDFARFNRVEGLAIGQGIRRQLGNGFSATARGRYGIDDKDGKGTANLAWQSSSGFGVRAFGIRDFRELGDQPERSIALNSIAAQEFGSDYTDPYLVRGGGLGLDLSVFLGFRLSADASLERHDSLAIHAHPVTGTFAPTPPIEGRRYYRFALRGDRPTSLWLFGTELEAHLELRSLVAADSDRANGVNAQGARGSLLLDIERPFGDARLVLNTAAGFSTTLLATELTYFGGPITAPGYDYHSLWSKNGVSQRAEVRLPIPFFPFSLGRFGRVPSRAALAPYVGAAYLGPAHGLVRVSGPSGAQAYQTIDQPAAAYPFAGIGFLTPFDLIRLDVARGLHNGRWFFYIDVNREFWSIL